MNTVRPFAFDCLSAAVFTDMNKGRFCFIIFDALRDLLPFIQFNKREKHLENCYFEESNTSPWVFFMFFKLHKWYQITQSVSYTNFEEKNKTCGLKNTSLRLFIHYGFFVIRSSMKLSSHQKCSIKKLFLNISHYSWESTRV